MCRIIGLSLIVLAGGSPARGDPPGTIDPARLLADCRERERAVAGACLSYTARYGPFPPNRVFQSPDYTLVQNETRVAAVSR